MEEESTQDNSSSSGTQRGPDVALQRSTPNEDATSQRDRAGSETTVHDPEKKRLHEEAIAAKKRAKEFEAQLAELRAFKEQIEDSQRSEQEKQALSAKKLQEQLALLQKERDDALTLAKTARVQSAIQLHAIQQGIDPKLATRLLDTSVLELDEATGNPTNLDTAFKAMISEFGLETKKQPVSSAGRATNPARSQTSAPQELSWEVITELQRNPDEYNRRNANGDISRWIAAHPFRYGQRKQ
jgi:hypothetical protein